MNCLQDETDFDITLTPRAPADSPPDRELLCWPRRVRV